MGLTADCMGLIAGANYQGELGDGSTTASEAPMAVSGGGTWSAISTGTGFSCGIKTGGALFCWGEGGVGWLDLWVRGMWWLMGGCSFFNLTRWWVAGVAAFPLHFPPLYTEIH